MKVRLKSGNKNQEQNTPTFENQLNKMYENMFSLTYKFKGQKNFEGQI